VVRKIALVLFVIAVLALIGIGYLQFADESAYIAATVIPHYQKIEAGHLTEVRFAKLRDRNLQHLITDQAQIVGKYASRDIVSGELFVDNTGVLLDELPGGRCFASGRCLKDGDTAWMMPVDQVDTLGGRVTLEDYLDIVLIDRENKRLTLMVQMIQPLEIADGQFIFGFSPAQVSILRGLAEDENLRLAILLNQDKNTLHELLQQYTMDYRQFPADLFPLPTSTPLPSLPTQATTITQ
jgi:hypothetical protein